jgi:predicted ATP-binding protein involved in virulence
MRIKNIYVENFRGFEKLEVSFPETSNVIVLMGANGSGKTSLLDGIRASLGFYIGFAITYEPELAFLLNEKDIRIGSKFYNFQSKLQPDEGEDFWVVNISNRMSEASGKIHYYKNYDNDNKINITEATNLPLLLYVGSKIYRNAIGVIPKFQFKQYLANYNALNAPLSNFIDFLNWFKLEKELEDKYIIKTRNFDYFNPSIKIVSEATTTFLSNLSGHQFTHFRLETIELPIKSIYDNQTLDRLVIDKNGVTLEVDSLSAGEKMLFLMVADISRRLTLANPSLPNPLYGTGIILIDEIDLHLHPQWQRTVLSALTTTFPNIQFIVTTHSPQVLSQVKRESVVFLEDGKVVQNIPNTYGRDSNSLLWELFATPERPKEIQVLISESATLIDQEKYGLAQQKINELSAQIGKNDKEVLGLQTELNYYLHETE